MSIINLLLETDVEKLQAENSKEVEIERLSKVLGKKFAVTCRALTNEQVGHILEVIRDDKETKFYAIAESCRIEGKKLNNNELMDKFKVMTTIDLVKKLFRPGEISKLYEIINGLSGYGRSAVQEIKN